MDRFQIESAGVVYAIDGDRLVLRRGGTELADFRVAPILDGVPTAIAGWSALGDMHHVADLGGGDRLHFDVRLGAACLWLETDRAFLQSLTSLSDGRIGGDAWHSFIPDEWDRTWEIERDVEVCDASHFLGMNPDDPYRDQRCDGAGMTDPGDLVPTWIFNIPAHHCAWRASGEEWIGVCLPGAHAIGPARYRMHRQRFSLTFEAVGTTCPEAPCPVLYFQTGLREPYELCDRHHALSEALGLTRTDAGRDHPAWWAHPYYKSYDDQLRTEKEEGGFQGHLKEVDGELRSVLTTQRIVEWHAAVEAKTGLHGRVNLMFDQIYFNHYGDYRLVNIDLGGAAGFRRTIDELQARGVHVGLYFHPFTCSKEARFFKEHPDACLATNRLGLDYQHGVMVGSSGSVYFDWTHPATRAYLLDTVRFLLSDGPGCLNADWLCINNTYGPDPRYYTFYDPTWGTGDCMQLKVQRLIYECAKSAKPHCLVRRQSALAPYMEPWYDEGQCCEEWNGSTRNWWRRARIASRLIRHNVIGSDAWFVTLTKAYEYFHGLAVTWVPATYASSHTIHPYLSYRPLKEKDYRRRRAGMQAYMNAPQWMSDTRRVDLTDADVFVTAWRRRTEGPLAGFYAALALSPRCQVTYAEDQALISASESRSADVPLPPGARLLAVERVGHDGTTAPHEHEVLDGAVRTHVEDAASETMHVRLRYALP